MEDQHSQTQTLKQIHHLPHSTYITTLRYLSPLPTTTNRHVITSTFNTDTNTPSLTLHSLTPKTHSQTPTLNPTSSFTPSSRITSLKTSHQQNPLIAAATLTGSVHILSVGANESSAAVFESEISIPEKTIHDGGISGIDMGESGEGCVSCGEDGRVNLISVGESGLDYRRVVDGKGLVGYSAVKWASGSEFVTGGFGNLVQWWDLRRSGGAGPVLQFKGNWARGASSGIVHSIDIHPSRKHMCLAGGSNGTVFVWDVRRPQQPIILSGMDTGEATPVISESDVWEVQYDTFTSASSRANISSERVLPTMICSEDGILAVIKQGEDPNELLAENCAINSFDIDRHNPSDVICSLEWESIAILTRA